jgi:4-hydroxy-2-oxoheptanedioate aldolase
VVVQIETAAGLEAAEGILGAPGVDVVFPGPVDLGLSLGLGASYATFQEIATALAPTLERLEALAATAGVAVMRHCETPEAVQAAAAAGCRLIGYQSDLGLLGRWASPLGG